MILTHTYKPKKAVALDLVLKLKRGESLEPFEIDSLINYFAPAIPKKAKTAEQWLAKACGADDYKQYIHVIDGVAYACDSHRLHYRDTDLADGHYEPKTMAAVEYDRRVPPFTSTIPSGTNYKSTEAANFVYRQRDNVRQRYLPEVKLGIAEQYFVDATNGDDSVMVHYLGGVDPVYGEHEFGKFVVAPVRI